ncbi:hypothetical protein M1271_02425 [Patescibacteria group bacterium]|nr:hypothetical protein [Patescibacteria group bacterium]MCL5797656.1 hypothetical protein [Patescibacteria group bacterium]
MQKKNPQGGILYFWHKQNRSQKLTLVLILLLLPFVLLAALNKVNIFPKAAIYTPSASIFPTVTPPPVALPDILNSKGPFLPQEQVAAKVGQENIYNKDLNYAVYSRYYSELIKPSTSSANLKNKVLSELIDDSILLQASQLYPQIFGNVNLNQSIFDNIDKDYQQRDKTLEQLKDSFKNKLEEKISGGRISIWYHNVNPPAKYSIEEARTIAQNKIQAIYQNLISGKITFSEAGNQIKNDDSLIDLDPNYKGNAIYLFDNVSPDTIAFPSQQVKDMVLRLKPGQISTVTEQQSPKPSSIGEEFFAIWTITNITNSGEGDLPNWIDKQKSSFNITTFN